MGTTFSEEARSYGETRKRTSAEYVKFTEDYRTVLRMLNTKHWIAAANGGRGMGAVCLNTEPRMSVCPIEKMYEDLPRENEDRRANNARRKFVVNVLDRTPHTTCKHCSTLTPGIVNVATGSKQCKSCGGDLKGSDFAPLDRVKILEQGPRLFNESLNAIATMQKEDLGKDITEYDITFTAQGSGRDRRITAIPQDPKPLPKDALLDKETGEPQKVFDLDLLGEPPSIEEMELMLEGATIDQLNALKGIV
jgi:hypothetical protein